jgi:hypothetical protein
VFQRLIPKGEQSLLQTRTATTESLSLCIQMKTAFVELEAAIQNRGELI